MTKGNSIYNDSSPAGVLYFPAQFPDSVIDRDNFSDEKKLALEIYNKKLTSFRMSGLIVGEENLSFMEANKKGKFIKNKRDLSNVITEKAFARLSNFVVGKVVDLTQKIFGGYINSVPSLKNDVFHCENCDYWSACGNYKNERNHIIRKVDADILLNKINEEGGENDAELD